MSIMPENDKTELNPDNLLYALLSDDIAEYPAAADILTSYNVFMSPSVGPGDKLDKEFGWVNDFTPEGLPMFGMGEISLQWITQRIQAGIRYFAAVEPEMEVGILLAEKGWVLISESIHGFIRHPANFNRGSIPLENGSIHYFDVPTFFIDGEHHPLHVAYDHNSNEEFVSAIIRFARLQYAWTNSAWRFRKYGGEQTAAFDGVGEDTEDIILHFEWEETYSSA